MGYRRRASEGPLVRSASNLDGALEAMPAEDLRVFVRDALARLDDETRARLTARLIAQAAKGGSGWRPPGPSRQVVDEAKRFAEAARRTGCADPVDVDEYLHAASEAFLAGDHAAAREVFAAFLPPLACGDIDVGQHEMLDEVLAVDEQECAGQYVASVYLTTPLEERAPAVGEAIDAVRWIAAFGSPLEQMEHAVDGALPEIDAFLPAWVRHLEQRMESGRHWGHDDGRSLREAILRLEGVAGLERIARETKEPEALRAWCNALVERRNWAEALRAYDDAVEIVEPQWRGAFLDGAALAAQQLGRPDATERLQAAWLGAPTLSRLLRWLGAGGPAASTLSERAREALDQSPSESGRQLGLLHLLAGNVGEAAQLLAKAPGLGWSSDGHPGQLLFPAFAGLLADGASAALSTELAAGLQAAPGDPWAWDEGRETRLNTPAVAELITVAGLDAKLDSESRAAMLEGMRSAATRRVDGLLGKKRRRHYGQAAELVACCVELAPVAGMEDSIADWLDGLRADCSRFSAFQGGLNRELGSIAPRRRR